MPGTAQDGVQIHLLDCRVLANRVGKILLDLRFDAVAATQQVRDRFGLQLTLVVLDLTAIWNPEISVRAEVPKTDAPSAQAGRQPRAACHSISFSLKRPFLTPVRGIRARTNRRQREHTHRNAIKQILTKAPGGLAIELQPWGMSADFMNPYGRSQCFRYGGGDVLNFSAIRWCGL